MKEGIRDRIPCFFTSQILTELAAAVSLRDVLKLAAKLLAVLSEESDVPVARANQDHRRAALLSYAYSFLQVKSSNIRQPSPKVSLSMPRFLPNSFSPSG